MFIVCCFPRVEGLEGPRRNKERSTALGNLFAGAFIFGWLGALPYAIYASTTGLNYVAVPCFGFSILSFVLTVRFHMDGVASRKQADEAEEWSRLTAFTGLVGMFLLFIFGTVILALRFELDHHFDSTTKLSFEITAGVSMGIAVLCFPFFYAYRSCNLQRIFSDNSSGYEKI